MSPELYHALLVSTWQTVYMIIVSGALSVLIGIPLGVLLLTTRRDGLLEQIALNKALSFVVNVMRSVPFIILLVALVPLTRHLVGTSIGTTAAIVPLTLAAIPFVGRLVENVLEEVSPGLIEAGNAMGATAWQIIFRIMLPESLSGIINAITVTLVTLVGYSAMAGAVGGGGLGDLAIRYGYQRFNVNVMIATVVILVVFVQLLQVVGDCFVKRYSH